MQYDIYLLEAQGEKYKAQETFILFITDEKKAKGSKQFLPLRFFPILILPANGVKNVVNGG